MSLASMSEAKDMLVCKFASEQVAQITGCSLVEVNPRAKRLEIRPNRSMSPDALSEELFAGYRNVEHGLGQDNIRSQIMRQVEYPRVVRSAGGFGTFVLYSGDGSWRGGRSSARTPVRRSCRWKSLRPLPAAAGGLEIELPDRILVCVGPEFVNRLQKVYEYFDIVRESLQDQLDQYQESRRLAGSATARQEAKP